MQNETVKKAKKLKEKKSDFLIDSKKRSPNNIINDNLKTKNKLDIECIREKPRKSKSKPKKVMKKSDLNTDISKKLPKIIVKNDGKLTKFDSINKNTESSQNILNSITPKNMLDIPGQSKLKIQIPVEDAEKEDMIKKSNIAHSKVGKNGLIVIREKKPKKNAEKPPQN